MSKSLSLSNSCSESAPYPSQNHWDCEHGKMGLISLKMNLVIKLSGDLIDILYRQKVPNNLFSNEKYPKPTVLIPIF